MIRAHAIDADRGRVRQRKEYKRVGSAIAYAERASSLPKWRQVDLYAYQSWDIPPQSQTLGESLIGVHAAMVGKKPTVIFRGGEPYLPVTRERPTRTRIELKEARRLIAAPENQEGGERISSPPQQDRKESRSNVATKTRPTKSQTKPKTAPAQPQQQPLVKPAGSTLPQDTNHPYALDYRRFKTGKLRSMPHYAHANYHGLTRGEAAELRLRVKGTLPARKNRAKQAVKPSSVQSVSPLADTKVTWLTPSVMIEAAELLVFKKKNVLSVARVELMQAQKLLDGLRRAGQ